MVPLRDDGAVDGLAERADVRPALGVFDRGGTGLFAAEAAASSSR
jgi:hypothetical protein